MNAKDLVLKMKNQQAPCVLDVRSGIEYRSGHIPGAVHATTLKILLRLAALPKDKNALIVVTCEHGPRAQMAKSLLGLMGYANLDLLEGHMSGWRRSGFPVEK